MKSVDEIREQLLRQIERAEATIEEWKVTFADDPCYGLEWSDRVFTAAARLRVFREVHMALGSGRLTSVDEHCLRTLVTRARNPQHSTSLPSNLVNEQLTQAWAEVLEFLDGMEVG